jgi:glycosyltransferase involved in cell wall biosynthesis
MIHVVYPHLERITPPDVIGHRLGQLLQTMGQVRLHDHQKSICIQPQAGDVLIGHADPCPYTTLRWSWRQPGWRLRVLLQPFSLDPAEHGHLDDLIDSCDWFLALSGDHWMRRLAHSRYAPFLPKIRQLDLGLDLNDFPRLKARLAPPGQRRWLYIGNDHPGKGVDVLDRLAQAMGQRIDWVGPHRRGAHRRYPHLNLLGPQDWTTRAAQRLLAEHDFVLMVGAFDACPTVVLEAMAWGLVPVCTPTTGYEGAPGVLPIDTTCVQAALETLNRYQHEPASVLEAVREAGLATLQQRYTWSRFAQEVTSTLADRPVPCINTALMDTNIASRLPRWNRACLATLIRNLVPRSLLPWLRILRSA